MFLLVCFALAMLVCFAFLPYGLRDLARGRKYKSGTGWCVWRWTDVRSEYILRLHVLKTPWFAVCLHWINKPDPEPWLHDHPVSFLSIILRGKYAELRQTMDALSPSFVVHRWFNFVRASDRDRHKIMFVRPGTLTLCLMGTKTREWGYHTSHGWEHWKDYDARIKREGEPLDGMTWGVFWKDFDKRLDALSRNFIAKYSGRIFLDEDKRLIDTAPAAEFKPEPLYTVDERALRAAREDFSRAQGGFTKEHVAQYRLWAERDGEDVSEPEDLIRYALSGRWMGGRR